MIVASEIDSAVTFLSRIIHKFCHALACSFARNEYFVNRSYMHDAHPASIRCEQSPGAIITAIYE